MHFITQLRSRASALRTAILLGVLAAGFVGCQSVNHLREAQDSFNQAAELENRQKLNSFIGSAAGASDPGAGAESALADLSLARSGYAAALVSLQELSDSEKARLRDDQLLGTAVTLQALAEWRLQRYDAALKTAQNAQTTLSDQLFPRDAALLMAIEGLIKIDLAYHEIATMDTNSARAQEILTHVRQRLVGPAPAGETFAVEDIQSARNRVGAGHPVNVYLIQAQLAAYRNYQSAFKRANRTFVPNDDPARLEAGHQLFELQALFDQLEAGASGQQLVQTWREKYSILPKPRP